MRKILVICSLFIVIFAQTVSAVDSTPSADIVSKLKEFQKGAASKAAQLKELISKKLQNKAYIGSVQSQSGNSLTLSAKSGPKMISINADTIIAKKIKAEDYVAALGDVDETGVLIAKKIVLEASPSGEPKTYLWGKVISVSDDLVTLRDNNQRNIAASFPKSPKLKLNDIVISTGTTTKNIFEAEFVYVIATRSATPASR